LDVEYGLECGCVVEGLAGLANELSAVVGVLSDCLLFTFGMAVVVCLLRGWFAAR